MSLLAASREGAQRLVRPEETLRRIEAARVACGITRCADVTGLDELGIPVYCAIRPGARVQQVSNGKGLTRDHARVSALMEAIELWHAEEAPPGGFVRTSAGELRSQGVAFLDPRRLAASDTQVHWDEARRVDWSEGRDLEGGERVLVPGSFVSFVGTPRLHATSTNGLASGNHVVEATLHALYELVERDAAAELLGSQVLPIRERCRVLDLASIRMPLLADAVERIQRSGSRLVVLAVPSPVPVYTFWAVLMNPSSWISGSTFNTGWGTHLDVGVALARAVTEAAQSRATMIHGAREDVLAKAVFRDAVQARSTKAWRFFEELRPDTTLEALLDPAVEGSDDLESNLTFLVRRLTAAGHRLVRCDLTRPDLGVPVVKVVSPTLRLRQETAPGG
jgi:ribosomal protein S12 methylthiotransferase accessory factor